ncbi:MAG: ribonuclease III [Clostridiales bacterium]|jgi:ribonuclease-3|nr:ribonuclease III [Clostridiales bacterium]
MEENRIIEIENRIGYGFKNKSLLCRAFTHNSYANQFKTDSYQLLEFLGDSIVGFIVAEYFVKHEFNQNGVKRCSAGEGECTRRKSFVVSNPSLAKAVKAMGLNKYLLLGEGEKSARVFDNESVCSDLFEALAAAIYLDASNEETTEKGLAAVRGFVLRFLGETAETAAAGGGKNDFKTALNELAAKRGFEVEYECVRDAGPAHSKEFEFRVIIGGEEKGTGVGKTKREAQQNAARAALDIFKR